jgi:competence ComEA-like helix-hairpin-helix protein
MPSKVKINVANRRELLELPGVGRQEAEAIVKFRSEHGPIADADGLRRALGGASLTESIWDRVDFAPAYDTAPEAPGA